MNLKHYFAVCATLISLSFLTGCNESDTKQTDSQANQSTAANVYESDTFTLFLQDRKGGTTEELYKVTRAMVDALKERPEIGMATTSYNIKFHQYEVSVDPVECKRAGTTPKEVLSVLNGYYGGTMSTRIKYRTLYQVRIQADPKYRKDKQGLHNIYVRIGEEMAPITQFIKVKEINGADRLARFNMFPAFSITGRAAEGRSSGEALKAVAEVAKEVLPPGYGYDCVENVPYLILIEASYPGASVETIQESVIKPLELAINNISNISYISSEATCNEKAYIRIKVARDSDINTTYTDVQYNVMQAIHQLPLVVVENGVDVRIQTTKAVKRIALYSPNGSYDKRFISNYIAINLAPAIPRISGVSNIEIYSHYNYSLNIWLNPNMMRQYRLIPQDIINALNEQDFDTSIGSIGDCPMRYKGRFKDVSDYENVVIRVLSNGNILRLKDVADIELGTNNESDTYGYNVDGLPAIEFAIFASHDADVSKVGNEIDKFLEKAREDFPVDLCLKVLE